MDSRRPAEHVDGKSGVVREGRKTGRRRSGFRLDPSVGAKARSGIRGFGKPEVSRPHRLDAERREQLAHLPELAGIVGGYDETAIERAMVHGSEFKLVAASRPDRSGYFGGAASRLPATSRRASAGRPAWRCPCAPARAG